MDIEFKNFSLKYSDKTIFENFSLKIQEGKITCILGDSGVGKTTLLGAIAGMVNFDGTLLKPNNDVSYIFQNDRLIPNISVEKNLDLVIKTKIKNNAERKQIINDALKSVELEGEGKRFPHQLSGGMASRVAMARGFIFPSEVLLMDESFKGLDPALKSRLIKVFIALYNKNSKTVILVTHSIDEALLLADNIVVIKGNPAEIVLSSEITIPQLQRKLTDQSLDVIRKELLQALL